MRRRRRRGGCPYNINFMHPAWVYHNATVSVLRKARRLRSFILTPLTHYALRVWVMSCKTEADHPLGLCIREFGGWVARALQANLRTRIPTHGRHYFWNCVGCDTVCAGVEWVFVHFNAPRVMVQKTNFHSTIRSPLGHWSWKRRSTVIWRERVRKSWKAHRLNKWRMN